MSHRSLISISALITPIVLTLGLSSLMSACFEELDPPSVCYNLDEVPVSNDALPTGVSKVEYQFQQLKDEALHCEVATGEATGVDLCREFYVDKFDLKQYEVAQDGMETAGMYAVFPGLDCLSYFEVETSEYGYCDFVKPSDTGCACFFDRDCKSNERCYAARRYNLSDCGENGNACTRCLPKEDSPALR